MKKYFLSLLITLLMMNLYAQNHLSDPAKADFNLRMESYINSQLANPNRMAAAKQLFGHTCDKDHIVTADEIKARVSEAERGNFIQANLAEYMRLYFPQNSHRGITSDTLICDNGGFEDDFLYYRGHTGLFTNGSNTCTPLYGSDPVTWTPVTMPVSNRFEIMTTGADPLVGIQKVKFGNKSLRVNNRYGHGYQCSGDFGIDRVTKRFLVTEENRIFTVWFALVLNVAPAHDNYQSFFNIKCDKAPKDEFCFDAEFLSQIVDVYNTPCFSSVKVAYLDWACHTIRIPADSIGKIATLEITVSDCGAGGHFGYGYIDGLCEPCDTLDTTFGYTEIDTTRIGYYSCDGQTARICGSYTLPTICDHCQLTSVSVPGYTITNITIDKSTKSYCFDFPLYNFDSDTCIDIVTETTFGYNGSTLPPKESNPVRICKSAYARYDYSVSVGGCHNNATTDYLSDDYYYVTVTVEDPQSNGWKMTRQLLDPYPNESGIYTYAIGSGTDTLVLGPFLIQEGCWRLILDFPGCEYNEIICPPDFCSGCTEFRNMKIGNVQCSNNNLDEWEFDIYVTSNDLTGTYSIKWGPSSETGFFNQEKTIPNLGIGKECIEFTIEKDSDPSCLSKFTVCPPKKCLSNPNCDLEGVVKDVECSPNGKEFYFTIDVWNEHGAVLCYSEGGNTPIPYPTNGRFGPYRDSLTIIIYACNNANCICDCYKVFKVFKPDCGSGHFNTAGPGQPRPALVNDIYDGHLLQVIPNPIDKDELRIVSSLSESKIEIYNMTGTMLHQTTFRGGEYRWKMATLPSGQYYIKYQDNSGKTQSIKSIKFIKL